MSALTRIYNNQIYNSTIIGYQKIAAGTITGSLFASNVTVPGDLLIAGNLFVLGTSAYTTIASTNTYVNDPLVTLNNGFSGTNNRDIGLVLNRGTDQNQAIVWAEPFKEFRLIGTTETGTTYGNVVASNFANLHVGNIGVDYAVRAGSLSVNSAITASSLNLSGNLLASTVGASFVTASTATFGNVAAGTVGNVGTVFTGASINITGNILSTGAVHNALTVNGNETVTGFLNVTGNVLGAAATFSSVLSNGVINTTGNVLATAGLFNALTVNGNETISGYINAAGNIGTPQLNAGQINTTGNVIGQAGTFNALTVNGNESVTGYLNVTGNVMAAAITGSQINTTGNVIGQAGTFNALTVNGNESVTGFLNVTGNILATTADVGGIESTGVIYANSTLLSTSTTTGALQVAGGVGVAGNLNLGTVGSAGGQFHTVRGNITQSSSGGIVYFNTSGNILAAIGNFGAINSTGYINTSGNISTPQLNAGQINTTGNVLATAGVFNALTVNGNESVTGYLNVTGNVMAAAGTFSSVLSNGVINTTGNVLAQAGVFNALTVNGNESVTGFLNVSGNILGATGTLSILGVSNNLWANASIATTAQGTGAVVIPNGGISVSGNANIGSTLTVGGATQLNSTLGVGGITTFTNSTNATTISDGAVRIQGGASVLKDLYVGGNLYAANIIGVTANVITVQDPLLYLRPSYTFPYNYDIGFYSAFTGAGLTTAGNVYQHTGLVRNEQTNTWTFASNLAEPGSGHVVFDNNTVYDPVKAGNLELTVTTNSTSTTTGALIVGGGAGIGGTVVAAQLNSTGNVLGQAGTFNALTVNGNESVTGYLNVTGNVMTAQLNAGQINTTGNVLATGGVFNSMRVNGNDTVTGFLNVTGNVLASTVGASFLTASTVAVGNIAAVNFGNTGAIYTGASINLSGNVLATNVLTNFVTADDAVIGNISAAVFGNTGATFIGSSINLSGNVLAASGVYNFLDVNGNVDLGLAGAISGSWINVIGNITQTSSGGAVYFNTTGNISTAQLNAGQINTTGNVLATAGVFNGLTVNGNESVTGFLNVTGNVLASTVRASFLTASTAAVGNIAAVTIGNSGATITGTIGAFSGNIIGGLAQFAAINSTPIGNATASTGSFTDLRAANVLWANVTVDTNGYGIGAINVPNGGIAALGNIITRRNVYAGPLAYEVTSGFEAIVFAGTDANQFYVQSALLNLDNRGSTDFAAYASDGSDGIAWADMGFTGNAFADPNYTITKPNDGYFIVKPGLGWGGNLVLATSNAGVFNDVVVGVGNFTQDAEVARFSGNVATNGNLRIRLATISTSTTSGALQVVGGVGVGGNIRVGGGAVFNSSQSADPFQVRGVATTSLIYADTAQGAVIIGGSNVAPQLGSTLKINGTDSFMLPIGTSAQRPGLTGNIDVRGMMRFNTTINNMEFYDGSIWQTSGSVFTIISDRQFSGNVGGGYGNVDGTNTTFTIQANSTTAGTIVSINGVIQFPVLAYSVTGTTLTFTEPPAPDDVVDVRVLSTTSSVSTLASGNGLQQFIASDTAAEIWTGVGATFKQLQINRVGDVEYLNGGKTTYTQVATNIAANNTPYVVATYSQTEFTTAKFLISAKRGATNFQSMETLVTTDGQGNAYVTTYAVVSNGAEMGGITANVVGGNVQVYWTTTTNITNANVKAMGTFIV